MARKPNGEAPKTSLHKRRLTQYEEFIRNLAHANLTNAQENIRRGMAWADSLRRNFFQDLARHAPKDQVRTEDENPSE